MPYRISYRDTTDVNRLLAVTESLVDGHILIEAVSAEVPSAAGRLTAAEDLILGLDLQVVQPPQTLDTAGGLQVVYLGGAIDACDDWQTTAITALRPYPVVIVNPRRERPTLAGQDTEQDVRWRRGHLSFADIALFWFGDGDPDPMAMLELGTQFDSSIRLVVGASPHCTRRAALAAELRYVETSILYDSLDETIAAAADFAQQRPERRLAMSSLLSEPAAVAWALRHTIEADRDRKLGERLDEIVREAARAGGVSFDPLLLTRVYVAVDRLRLDGGDPLGWAQLHQAATALRAHHTPD